MKNYLHKIVKQMCSLVDDGFGISFAVMLV